MSNYYHVINWLLGQPWAIMPEKLALIQKVITERHNGITLTDDEIKSRILADGFTERHEQDLNALDVDAKARPRAGSHGTVAVINLFGVISHRISESQAMSGDGGTSIEKTQARLKKAVADPAVKSIVLNIDSPGGSVSGVKELADDIMEARNEKHIVAVANSLAASAAYWIASAADELVVTPSGSVGSIGVYTMHENYSKWLENEGVDVTLISAGKYKVEANPFQALSEEARAAIQQDVDEYYDMFIGAVAKGRGVTGSVVKSQYGQGRVLTANAAKKNGMVDRVATLEQVLANLGVKTSADQQKASLDIKKKRLSLLSQ